VVRRKLGGATTTPRRDWAVLAQAWLLLLAVDWCLRALSFRRVQRLVALGRRRAGEAAGDTALAIAGRLQKLVDVAARNHLYPMGCLRRSLALQWLLGRRGIVAELRIGVRREGEGLRAHAWLECGGQPVGEPEGVGAEFAPLAAQGAPR